MYYLNINFKSMKKELLLKIKMMSKWSFRGLLLQLILSGMVIAEPIKAQNTQSVREVVVEINIDRPSILQVFANIEAKTDFTFHYHKVDIDQRLKLDFNFSTATVAELLETISEKAHLKFKQINNNIYVNRIANKRDQKLEVVIQARNITGKVIAADNNEGLPGVNVIEKGTSNGTVTNLDGAYSLQVSDGATLVFSSVGYMREEVELGNRTVIDLVMRQDIQQLEELVVIGYGAVRKGDLTGSVSSITGDLVSERKTTQISQALQGSIPGVMVTRNNNAPGSSATIRIRGITTIGDSEPLIIVDGVPVNNINWINPNDVESISVLKDAASASIYGSRAAAGVILVTTKRARPGELSLDYNVEYGQESPTSMPEYVDIIRYMQIKNELRWNDNGNPTNNEYPRFAKDLVDNYMNLNSQNPDLYPNTDWVDLIMRRNAPRSAHTLGVTVGTDAIRSKISLAYDQVDALYHGRTYERITTRFNNDVTINKFISATLDINYRRSIGKQPSMDPMYTMLISAPIYAAEWSDGRVAGGKDGNNIYGQIKYGGWINDYWNQIGGKMSLDVTPIEGLKFSAIISPNMTFDKRKNFQKEIPYTAWDDPTRIQGRMQWATSTDLYENRNDAYQVTTQFLANYLKRFNNHSINLMGGYENYYAYYENLGASRERYELTSFPYLNLGPLTYRGNSGSAWENAYQSWFGRAMYNYMNRYLLQANIRYDASSRFHRDYRWGAFPSFSAGWVVSEESFMNNLPVLSYLKVRGSWGNLGNERIGNYPYQSTIGFSNALFHRGTNVVSAQTAAQWQYAIRDITWESTETYGVGFDLGFFDSKLLLTADYYQKTTKDMLLEIQIPIFMGYDNPDQNTGKMNTKGWELDATYNNRAGNLDYSISFNLSDFKSIMGDLGGTEFLGAQIKKKGSEFNEWYGYLSDGLFQTQDEVANSAKTSAAVRPGDVKYKDISGPNGVPDGIISPEYDRVLLGGSLPRYMYGGNIRLGLKSFDFSMVIQGVGKQNSRLSGLMVEPIPENWGHIPKILDGKYWSVYSTPEQNLNAQYPRMSRITLGNNYAMSDYWLINGAYLRMKNISFGYTIPQSILERIFMKNIRLYTTFSDVFTLNKFPKGWDPEVSATGYPITTSVVFGASVKF
jgi:TonB-linked SusC/RagA family outer membrane protein